MFDYRQRITDEHDPHAFRAIGKHGRLDVHHRAHTKGIAVVLVQGNDVEAEILRMAILVEIVMIVVGSLFAIEELIRNGEVAARR